MIKGKNRLKVLAILSSVSLWFYVMAVVDPESDILFEDLPVNISNTVELSENNLILSSDTKPTIDVLLEGRLSDLRRLKKENIRASIEIQNPSEGKNEATISVSVPNNISYNIKENNVVVQLEKNIYTNKEISVKLPQNKDASDYLVSLSYDSVKISGPRSAVKKVDKVVANIKEDSFMLNKSIGVQLKAVDSRGIEVENAMLENSIINVTIKKIEQKEVDIIPVLDKNINLKDVIVSPSKIFIRGESSLIETIDFLETNKISFLDLKNKDFIEAEIVLPKDIFIVEDNTTNKEVSNKVLVSLKAN